MKKTQTIPKLLESFYYCAIMGNPHFMNKAQITRTEKSRHSSQLKKEKENKALIK